MTLPTTPCSSPLPLRPTGQTCQISSPPHLVIQAYPPLLLEPSFPHPSPLSPYPRYLSTCHLPYNKEVWVKRLEAMFGRSSKITN